MKRIRAAMAKEQQRELAYSETELRQMEKSERDILKAQEVEDRARSEGFEKGSEEGARAVRAQAFADMASIWHQLSKAHLAASEYAGVVAKMYSSRTNVKTKGDKDETPTST